MSDETTIDVSAPKFEEWVELVFDHPVAKSPDDNWCWNDLDFLVSNPAQLLKHITKLCIGFSEIVTRYSIQQINQGIWFLLCEPILAGKYLADSSVELSQRLECVRSMFQVYEDFVSKSDVAVMENCFDMWWEMICGDFWSAVGFKRTNYEALARCETMAAMLRGEIHYKDLHDDERAVLDVIFETLAKILKLGEERCEMYALHGLGHIRHPSVTQLVQSFLDAKRDKFTPEGVAWIESCRDGTVM